MEEKEQKLYCVEVGKSYLCSLDGCNVREVEIEKETKSQFKIKGGFGRCQVNKSQLGQDLGYSRIQIFTYNVDEAIEKAKRIIERDIERLEQELLEKRKHLESIKEKEAELCKK